MKYVVISMLQDVMPNGNLTGPYLEKGVTIKKFNSKIEAFEYAVKSANEELEYLVDDEYRGVSFGIPEDDEYQRMESVKIYYYNHEDDTTELVTERNLFEIEPNLIPGKFYDLDGDLLGETPGLDEICIALAERSLIGQYPELEINDENGNLDKDVVMAVAAEIKKNRYAFLDAVENIVNDFMCDKIAEPDERDEI